MNDEWVETTLGQSTEITIGRTPPRKEGKYWTDDLTHPFCTIADMDGSVIDPIREGVSEQAIIDGKAKMVPAGSLLMSFKLTIGRVGFAARDLYPNEAIAWIRSTDPLLDERYLGLWLSSQDLTVGSGRAVKGATLNGESLRAIRVQVPPLAVQRRIVDLLAHLDNHLASLQTEREAAEVLLKSTYDEVFACAAALRDLSSVLTAARAGGTPSRGNPDYYGGDVPWLKSGEVANSHIAISEESISSIALEESSAWLVPADSTVVAMYGATAGAAGYLDAPMATNQAVLALVPDQKQVIPRFLYHVLRWQSTVLKKKASGAAQPNLSKQVVLRETRFPDTPLEQQASVAAALDAIENDASSLEREINELMRVRGFLLRSLLSDSLSIPSTYDSFLAEVV